MCSPSVFADASYEQELKQQCSKIKNFGLQGKKNYDQKQYTQALKQFKNQAVWTAFCAANEDDSGVQLSQRDIELAYNNVGLTYSKLHQPGWSRAWYSVFPNSSISQYNLKQLPSPKRDLNLAGTYVQHAGFGQWNTLKVTRQKQDYLVQFNGLYMGARSLIYGPNIGDFETTLALNKTQTQYHSKTCQIDVSFEFDPKLGQRALLKQSGDISGCGFGHNVSANGIFLKVE